MFATLPLDVNNKQIRLGNIVAYSASDSCHMFTGRVFKITAYFVWMVPVGYEDTYKYNHRREPRQVVIIG